VIGDSTSLLLLAVQPVHAAGPLHHPEDQFSPTLIMQPQPDCGRNLTNSDHCALLSQPAGTPRRGIAFEFPSSASRLLLDSQR
jgi:hypothetical protein